MRPAKIILALALFSAPVFSQTDKTSAFSFIAFGDMPYTLPQDYARFDNVIKTINEQTSVFTVNVGDIKSSSTPCSDAYYKKILDYYQQFTKPLIYVPGDNEWTDCTKKDAGTYDAEERLEMIRKLFFKDNASSLGKEKMMLTVQSKNAAYSKFVENRCWVYGNIAFATVHIVGSNNNFLSTSTNGNKEFFERQEADLAWLEETFKNAKEKNNAAIVISIHADMFGSKDMKEASGFNQIKKKLKELVIDFKKPVLLINGDSHTFLIDKPFVDGKPEKTIDNFTRLQVPGEVNMNAVKISINPASGSLFQFEELIVTNK